MATARYPGVNRPREGGVFGTHKQDFNAHVTGGDWRHTASQIDVSPSLSGGSTVQDNLEAVVPYVLGAPYTVVVTGHSTTLVWNPRTQGTRLKLDLSAYTTAFIGTSILILQLDPGYTPLPGEVLEIIYYNFQGGPLQIDTSAIMTHLSTYPPEFAPILSDEIIRISYGSSIGSGWAVESRKSLCGGYSGYDRLRKLQERNAYILYPDNVAALGFRPRCVSKYQDNTGSNRWVILGGAVEGAASVQEMAIYLGDGGGSIRRATLPAPPANSLISDIAMYGAADSNTGLAVIEAGGSSNAKMLITTDSGHNWSYTPGSLPIPVSGLDGVVVGDILGVPALLVYEQQSYNHIFISTNNGVTWHQETLPGSSYRLMSVDFIGGRFVAVGYDSATNVGYYWRRGTQAAGSGTWAGTNVGVNRRLWDIHQNMAVGENGTILWAYNNWVSYSIRPTLYHGVTLVNDIWKVTKIDNFYVVLYEFLGPHGSDTSSIAMSSNTGQSFYTDLSGVSPVNGSIVNLRSICNDRKLAIINRSSGGTGLNGYFQVTGDFGSQDLLKL